MDEDIQENLSKIWTPIPSWQIGNEWITAEQTGAIGSLAGGLFIVAIVKVILAFVPVILSCIRCLCLDKENSSSSEVGSTTAASFSSTLGALFVIFAYKCDCLQFLQAGIGLCFFVIFLSAVEFILLFCSCGKACCQTDGCNCGSRIGTFLMFILQVLILASCVALCLLLVIYGTNVAFGSILSDEQKENLDDIIEKTKGALDNATDEILNE